MPDWKALVAERLREVDPSSVASVEEPEIVAELAAHLEDLYEELRGKGICESDAIGQAWGDISLWHGLAGRIRRAKEGEETVNYRTMNYRTRTLWLPGLIGLTASMTWLMILQRATLKPGLPGPWLHAGLAFVPYLVWQIAQPLFGAASAYLSRQAGADRRTELSATLFPAIVMFAVWVVLVACIVVTRYSHVAHPWPLVIAGTLNWSIFPGLSMLLGRSLCLKTGSMARA